MMLAGFEVPSQGCIFLEGRSIKMLPYTRNIGMVFQNYALFPHMTVEENLAFPFKVRRSVRPRSRPGSSGRSRWSGSAPMASAGLVNSRAASSSASRLPSALVFDPKLVLMDEPLGALDKQLREQKFEIKHIHEDLGLTVGLCAHDQGEALTMSDRTAVFNEGVTQQLAAPAACTSGRTMPSSPSARTTGSTVRSSR
ncbi:ATP-binding cassette domain-containing protein [Bradyrhizobium nanningense]|uniref:ATP-binding cassette domain-containing protein n=1 Tax=Bradyrhizobium nanningense TaxID=1325118 RepID=UPI0032215F50